MVTRHGQAITGLFSFRTESESVQNLTELLQNGLSLQARQEQHKTRREPAGSSRRD